MDAEFALAKKRQDRDREKLAKERLAKAERERRGQLEFAKAETLRLQVVQERERLALARREREEAEELNSGGIKFACQLRPVPLANLESDKIRLPSAVLHQLTELGAFNSSGQYRVLAFELALFGDGGVIVRKTHAGVLDFTAETEGTVELPVKVAMSLGLDTASSNDQIRVRLVSIDHFARVRVKVQPQGDGFHINDQEVVQLDLKSVLGRALGQQTALTLGDVFPVRNEGRTFLLRVRELWPDSPALLLDTDVEVDMLPCEKVEQRALELQREKDRLAEWLMRREALAASLPAEPPLAGGGGVITYKARVPGLTTSVPVRRFDKQGSTLQHVFDWAYSVLPADAPPLPPTRVLEIVLGPGKTIQCSSTARLHEVPALAHPQVLNFRWKEEESTPPSSPVTVPTTTNSNSGGEWTASLASAESHLDKAMMEVQDDHEEEEAAQLTRVDVFKLLVDMGADRTRAAVASQKYHACLLAVHAVGLLQPSPSCASLVLDMVDKFKGSSSRVIDAIMQQQQQQAAPPPVEDDYSAQADTLQAMFTERSRADILAALHRHAGNVERAANALWM